MFDFDEIIDRRGTHAMKWDEMETRYGVSPDDGIAMWVADMDFRPPPRVNETLAEAVAHGVHGYFGNDRAYLESITGWMARRHGWAVDPSAISTTHGVVAGVALALQAFTAPGDGVILFTPAATLTGRERMVIFCSPHNPGGTVWTRDEIRALADFAAAHDLVLVSDEIHHDLTFPGTAFVPTAVAAPGHLDRLVVLTSTTKTFNIAGALTGNVIIPDANLRRRFSTVHLASGTSPNRFGVLAATAAYAGGDAWLDALRAYLAENAALLETGLGAIPGVRPMRLASTYLAWVDFADTGMTPEEFTRRVEREARIAASHGHSFGPGGESFLRFNIATPRARVAEAVARLQAAFADLQ